MPYEDSANKAKAERREKGMNGNYADHQWMMDQLQKAMSADQDMRDQADEANLFLDARDGQWEQEIERLFREFGKPRYTFDMVTAYRDQIVDHTTNRDYDIVVRPAGGDSTKETAKTYDGLVRNIENISKADQIYYQAAKGMVTCGLAGWRVVQEYVSDDAFDQDLMVEAIADFRDRVWFGPHTKPDASDAKWGWVLTGVPEAEFESMYPDRPETGVQSDRTQNQFFNKQELVMIGEFYYLKEVKRDLVLLSNGAVVVDDDDFRATENELLQAGVQPVPGKRRTRTSRVVCIRKFDANGWIGEPMETVFHNWIPIVPVYGNFDYYDRKCIWYGAVEKLMDPQRVFNYAKSRQVEEGALSARELFWLTPEQAKGHETELAELNVSTEPYQLYNPDPAAPGPPQKSNPPQVNPSLQALGQDMTAVVQAQVGMFDASVGRNINDQSGKALERLQNRSDEGGNKYVRAMEVAQSQTGRILVNAIPRVYEPGRQIRLLREDGTYEMGTVGQVIIDQDSNPPRPVVLHDLGTGLYDLVCESGPSFKNRQNQTVSTLAALGEIDPSVIEISKDILISNIAAPGMDQVGRRVRAQLFQAGAIPFEDMTDQEKEQARQAQQQPPQESPEMVLARAEEAKGQADLADAQTKQAQVQGDIQIKIKQLELEQQKLQIQAFEAETDRYKAQIDAQKAGADIKAKGAAALRDLAEAESTDIENDAVVSGISRMMGGMNG